MLRPLSAAPAIALLLASSSAFAQQPRPADAPPDPPPAGLPESTIPSPNAEPVVKAGASQTNDEHPATLRIGLLGGLAQRLDSPRDLDSTQSSSGVFGAEIVASFAQRYAVGFSLERAGLGHEQGTFAGLGGIEVDRAMTMTFVDVRVRVIEVGDFGLHASVGAGLVFHQLDASGYAQTGFSTVPTTFTCSASSSADLGLRVRLGATYGLGPGFQVFADTGFDSLRGDDQIENGCAPGPGTATLFALRAGFGYAFDLSRVMR